MRDQEAKLGDRPRQSRKSQALLRPSEQPRAEGAKMAGAARTRPRGRPGLGALRTGRPRAGEERRARLSSAQLPGLARIAQQMGAAARSLV